MWPRSFSGSSRIDPVTATQSAMFMAAALADGRHLSDQDIRDEELARARHALAYLKTRIGDERMRDLLADDVATMTARPGRRWRAVPPIAPRRKCRGRSTRRT